MNPETHFQVILRIGDDTLILGQRLSEWCGHGPILEEDIAITNIALDLIGQSRGFLTHAGTLEGAGRDEDSLAYFRSDREFRNHLLVERPNGDFADTMARQFLFDQFSLLRYGHLAAQSVDPQAAALAAKAIKEVRYHAAHSGDWVVHLGDGTEESHARMQAALDRAWDFVAELFTADDVDLAAIEAGLLPDLDEARASWDAAVDSILTQATLKRPEANWGQAGGKTGNHSEHLSRLLAEMQVLPRTYPDATW